MHKFVKLDPLRGTAADCHLPCPRCEYVILRRAAVGFTCSRALAMRKGGYLKLEFEVLGACRICGYRCEVSCLSWRFLVAFISSSGVHRRDVF